MSTHSKSLSEGPIWRALARVSAPMSFGIFAVLSVGLADAYFLGQIGETELAAVGYIYPVTTAVTSLAIGLSAGANASLSQAIGHGDSDADVNRLALHSIGLGLLVSVIGALIFWVSAASLFSAMGAGEDVSSSIASYLPWWTLSFPFLVVMMILNAGFRAHGDGTTSAVIMVLVAVINVALDPLLIYGWGPIPAMEVGGAALATAIARTVITVAALIYAFKTGILGWCGEPLSGVWNSVKEITNVGLPAAFSNAINPAAMAAVTAAVATLGETAVAGFGAATRVQSLALVPLLAFSAGIGPVVGQNWGAERKDRVDGAMRLIFGFCVIYGTAAALVLTLAGPWIAGQIASDEAAADFTRLYLQFVSWTFFGYGILVTANAAMNARSKPLWSMGLSLARIFLIYLPFAWIGVWLFGFAGILAAAMMANVFVVWGALVASRATRLITTEVRVVSKPAAAVSGEA